MSEVSFQAKFIKPATIQKQVNGKYIPYQTSIVKAEYSDADIVDKTAKLWKRIFAEQAARAIEHPPTNNHVYLLTKQKDKYDKLIPEDILGMAYLAEYNFCNLNTLEYIQVRPDLEILNYPLSSRIKNFILEKLHIDKDKKSEYKGVGTNLVKCIQEIHNERKMDLCPINTASHFYKKLGFKPSHIFDWHMHWTPSSKNTSN